jgi:hypothetical protein
MRVTSPSTSGWIVTDRSDLSVAMNSELASMGRASRVSSLTEVGGGGEAAPCAARSPPQAAVAATDSSTASHVPGDEDAKEDVMALRRIGSPVAGEGEQKRPRSGVA